MKALVIVCGLVSCVAAFAGKETLKINCNDIKGKEQLEVSLETSDVFFDKDGMKIADFLRDKAKLAPKITNVKIHRAKEKMERPKSSIVTTKEGYDMKIMLKTGVDEDGEDVSYFIELHDFYHVGTWLNGKGQWVPVSVSLERDTHFGTYGHNHHDGYWDEKLLCTVN